MKRPPTMLLNSGESGNEIVAAWMPANPLPLAIQFSSPLFCASDISPLV